MGESIEKSIQGTSIYKYADEIQTAAEKNEAFKESLENIRSSAVDLGKELDIINKGAVMNKMLPDGKGNMVKNEDYDPLKHDAAKANTMQSLPVLDMLRELDTMKPQFNVITGEETGNLKLYNEGLKKIQKEMKGLEKVSPKFAAAVAAGNTEAVESMTRNAARFTTNIAGAKDQLSNMTNALKGASSEAVLIYVENIAKLGRAATKAGEDLDLTSTIQAELDERFKESGGIDGYIAKLKEVEATDARIKNAQLSNQVSSIDDKANLNSAFGAEAAKDNAAEAAELVLKQAINNEKRLKLELTDLSQEANIAAHNKLIEQGEREIELAKAKSKAATLAADDMAQMGLKIGDSLQSNMEGAFQSLVDGTKSAKEAFAGMAKAILADIAKMIIKMLVMKMLQATLGGTLRDFLGIAGGARNGGVFAQGEKQNGYRSGGVARGSQGGYPAMLHGTEAVVPLPNGRSIPVDMGKQSGQMVSNVTVNVSAEGNTKTESNDGGMDSEKLGKAVANAVQLELQNQKRSGGILNPYGAA